MVLLNFLYQGQCFKPIDRIVYLELDIDTQLEQEGFHG
jgi:hypothetical protein